MKIEGEAKGFPETWRELKVTSKPSRQSQPTPII